MDLLFGAKQWLDATYHRAQCAVLREKLANTERELDRLANGIHETFDEDPPPLDEVVDRAFKLFDRIGKPEVAQQKLEAVRLALCTESDRNLAEVAADMVARVIRTDAALVSEKELAKKDALLYEAARKEYEREIEQYKEDPEKLWERACRAQRNHPSTTSAGGLNPDLAPYEPPSTSEECNACGGFGTDCKVCGSGGHCAIEKPVRKLTATEVSAWFQSAMLSDRVEAVRGLGLHDELHAQLTEAKSQLSAAVAERDEWQQVAHTCNVNSEKVKADLTSTRSELKLWSDWGTRESERCGANYGIADDDAREYISAKGASARETIRKLEANRDDWMARAEREAGGVRKAEETIRALTEERDRCRAFLVPMAAPCCDQANHANWGKNYRIDEKMMAEIRACLTPYEPPRSEEGEHRPHPDCRACDWPASRCGNPKCPPLPATRLAPLTDLAERLRITRDKLHSLHAALGAESTTEALEKIARLAPLTDRERRIVAAAEKWKAGYDYSDIAEIPGDDALWRAVDLQNPPDVRREEDPLLAGMCGATYREAAIEWHDNYEHEKARAEQLDEKLRLATEQVERLRSERPWRGVFRWEPWKERGWT